MGMKDPVSVDELRHDLDSAARLREQDRLEAEFKADPDWDLVAECLIKRETVGDLCFLIWQDEASHNNEPSDHMRARRVVDLAIEQCAREYAEREAGK